MCLINGVYCASVFLSGFPMVIVRHNVNVYTKVLCRKTNLRRYSQWAFQRVYAEGRVAHDRGRAIHSWTNSPHTASAVCTPLGSRGIPRPQWHNFLGPTVDHTVTNWSHVNGLRPLHYGTFRMFPKTFLIDNLTLSKMTRLRMLTVTWQILHRTLTTSPIRETGYAKRVIV